MTETTKLIGAEFFEDLSKFQLTIELCLDNLFISAKKEDEAAFVFALLGISSGCEDCGWDPFSETYKLYDNFMRMLNCPINIDTQMRLGLLLYCQITESNLMWHVLYNMLLVVDESSPEIFNFLEKYKNDRPPSVKSKVNEIVNKSKVLGFEEFGKIIDQIFDSQIRNAVCHADFILWNDEVRFKHKRSEVQKKTFHKIWILLYKCFLFFESFNTILSKHRFSYEDGYTIKDRKSKVGKPLASFKLKVNKDGRLHGFTGVDPLPLW